jgi:hypothetical protein
MLRRHEAGGAERAQQGVEIRAERGDGRGLAVREERRLRQGKRLAEPRNLRAGQEGQFSADDGLAPAVGGVVPRLVIVHCASSR